MIFKKLTKQFKDTFGTEKMHKLILKAGEGNLTDVESKLVANWTNAYNFRENNFQKFLKVEEFRKRLRPAKDAELKPILRDLKKQFPDHFYEISERTTYYILKRVMVNYLAQLSWELSNKVVYGNRKILIMAYAIKMVVILIILLITLAILKNLL